MGHRPRLAGAIFDMDGLLVDSEPFWRGAEAEVFDGLGVDIRPLLRRGETMGLRVDEAVAFLIEASGARCRAIDATVQAVVAAVVTAIGSKATLLPGAQEALALFEGAGVPLVLASGSTPPVIDAVLERFGLRGRFEAVLSAADDLLGKPHPSIFLRAAGRLGVRCEQCVVLEDSLNGCIGAKAARMRVIAVPSRSDAADARFAIADLRLSSLLELTEAAALELLGLSSGDSQRAWFAS